MLCGFLTGLELIWNFSEIAYIPIIYSTKGNCEGVPDDRRYQWLSKAKV